MVAEGRDAVRFLHSQLTSDVQALAPGASQQTALLDRGGRLRAFGFLCRRTDRVEILLPTEIAASTVRRLEEWRPLAWYTGADGMTRVYRLEDGLPVPPPAQR